LIRSREDKRGSKVTGSGPYRNDDYYRVRIVLCLFSSNEHKLNRSKMLTNGEFGLNRMERRRLTLLLEEMIIHGWIKSFSTKYSPNTITYKLDERGLKMAETIKKFDESDPIFDLELFNNVKLLGC